MHLAMLICETKYLRSTRSAKASQTENIIVGELQSHLLASDSNPQVEKEAPPSPHCHARSLISGGGR